MAEGGGGVTHLSRIEAPLLCMSLVRWIREEAHAMPGTSLAAQAGDAWSSLKLSAPGWESECAEELDERVRMELPLEHRSARVEWWMTRLGPGGAVRPHDHIQARWSGVFYPATPRGAGGQLSIGDAVISPFEGLLVHFPPAKLHSVSQVQSGVRYSLAFNVM